MGDFIRSRRSPVKRTRYDYDDRSPPRMTYGSSRGGVLDVSGGYGKGLELRDYMLVPQGGGLSSNFGINSSLGLGGSLAGAGGVGIGSLDDPDLYARLAAYDTSLVGRASSFGLSGAPLRSVRARSVADALPEDASSTLFVDGLPTDCSRREAAHIFRPYVGFKDLRVVHKDPKREDGDKIVLCFVDFADPKCAAIALDALQGYKIDEKDPDSYAFRVTFAKYPGPRSSGYRDRSTARGRDRSPFHGRDRSSFRGRDRRR